MTSAGSSRGRRILKGLAGVVAVVVAIIVAGAVWESMSEAADEGAYPPPGQLVGDFERQRLRAPAAS